MSDQSKMPCSITDGLEDPVGYKEEDEDEAYELVRQQEIDDETFAKQPRIGDN